LQLEGFMRICLLSLALMLFASPILLAAEPFIIHVPAEPPTKETWHLEEVWRIDGDDPDAPLLGVPTGGFTAPDGNFLLLDHQMSHVLVLSPEGEFISTLSREGEGPGEISRPNSIFMCSDSVLGILQGYPSAIVRVNLDGTPLSAIKPTKTNGYMQKAKIANGVIIVAWQGWDSTDPSSSIKSNTNYLNRLAETGETLHTFGKKTVLTDWGHPRYDEEKSYFPANVWDLAADGTLLWANRRDQYRIEFISPEGEILKVIERPFTPYKRSKEDIEKLAEGVTYSTNGAEIEVETHFLPTDSAIQSIEVHDDGTIWVTSCYGSRNLPDGISRRYDVFESDGTFRSEVSIAYEYDDEKDGFGALADGTFMHMQNIASASEAMYKGKMAKNDEEEDPDDDEDAQLYVIKLGRVQ
jgi:hypothetical protein